MMVRVYYVCAKNDLSGFTKPKQFLQLASTSQFFLNIVFQVWLKFNICFYRKTGK